MKATGRDIKKSSGILCERKQKRLDFAKKELCEYDTNIVCRMLQVSKSGYYSHKIENINEKTEVENTVIHCFKKHNRNYGRIRIRKELINEGIDISEYRIAKILKKYGLVAKSGRTGKPKQPKPTEEQYIEENLIKDKFSVKEPNYLWCSDITVLNCYRQKIYVCGIIDVATRRLVGWDIAKHQRQEIVQNAFNMAVGRNPNRPKGAVYHSDRGCQYTAKKTKELVEQNGFRKSMSRPGTPSDNQPIESFWKTLEWEMTDISHLPFEEASRKIVEYIELYYNSVRLHSGINYSVPNQFFTLLSVRNS
ncbi:MAG: IS3 family transposase [Ruminococcus sp.]